MISTLKLHDSQCSVVAVIVVVVVVVVVKVAKLVNNITKSFSFCCFLF